MSTDLSNTRCWVLVDPEHDRGYAIKVVPVSEGDTVQNLSEASAKQGFSTAFAVDKMVTPQAVARFIPGIAKMPGVQFVVDLRSLRPQWPH